MWRQRHTRRQSSVESEPHKTSFWPARPSQFHGRQCAKEPQAVNHRLLTDRVRRSTRVAGLWRGGGQEREGRRLWHLVTFYRTTEVTEKCPHLKLLSSDISKCLYIATHHIPREGFSEQFYGAIFLRWSFSGSWQVNKERHCFFAMLQQQIAISVSIGLLPIPRNLHYRSHFLPKRNRLRLEISQILHFSRHFFAISTKV